MLRQWEQHAEEAKCAAAALANVHAEMGLH